MDILIWSAATWTSAPWTLWTSPWAHLSAAHFLGNAMALVALAAMAWQWGLLKRWGFAMLWVWPLSTASLLLCPAVTSSVGLSGLVHGGAALLVVFKAWSLKRRMKYAETAQETSKLEGIFVNSKNAVRPELVGEGFLQAKASTGSARTAIYRNPLNSEWKFEALWRAVLLAGLALGLLTKLWMEAACAQPVVWSDDWGFDVVQIAHLYGAITGAVVGLVAARGKLA